MNEQIVKQNMELVAAVTHYIFQHPDLLDRLPSDFRLVVLPDDDPDLSRYNLGLLSRPTSQDKPIVIVRAMAHQPNWERSAQVYVPLAV